jgi:hypothetical protein
MILRAENLLGDTLYLLKPLAEFHMQRLMDDVVIGVGPGFAGELVRRQFDGVFQIEDMGRMTNRGEVLDLSAGRAADIAVLHIIATRSRRHISECYAEMLGVRCDGWNGDFRPLTGWTDKKSTLDRKYPYAVIAPFSKSCARNAGMRPNKTPDHVRWGLLIDWLRSVGIEPRVLVGNGEHWTGADVKLVYTETLQELISFLADASVVISVDNGIGHVASALECSVLILWPPISSVPFIGPVWNEKTKLLFMRPERVRADQLCRLVSERIVV